MKSIVHLVTLAIMSLLSSSVMAGTEGVVSWGDVSWDESTGVGTMSVVWQSETEYLAGFQFNVPCQINSVSALACSDNWSLNLISGTVICYCDTTASYIQPGQGEVGLVTLEFQAEFGDEIVFVQPIFANIDSESIDLES